MSETIKIFAVQYLKIYKCIIINNDFEKHN